MALFHRAPADQADTVIPEASEDIRQKPTLAIIHLDRMIRNLQRLTAKASPAGIMPIIKADAYGHGLIPVARALTAEGVVGLGVSFLEEAVALRRAGIQGRILVMGGIVNAQIDHFLEFDLEMTASSEFKARAISEAAERLGVRAKVHAKIDTGMSRIGVNWEQADWFLSVLSELPNLDVVGIYSHLVTAEATEGEGYDFAREQIRRFRQSIDAAKRHGLEPAMVHIVNTVGLLNHPDARFSMIRPGLALYGLPMKTNQPLDQLQSEPVLGLISELVFLKGVRKGTPGSLPFHWGTVMGIPAPWATGAKC